MLLSHIVRKLYLHKVQKLDCIKYFQLQVLLAQFLSSRKTITLSMFFITGMKSPYITGLWRTDKNCKMVKGFNLFLRTDFFFSIMIRQTYQNMYPSEKIVTPKICLLLQLT